MNLRPLQFWLRRVGHVLLDDARRFYARGNLARLAVGVLLGAVLANSPFDSWPEDAYHRNVHSETKAAANGQWIAKQIGDRYVVVIAPITAMAAGLLVPASPVAAAVGSWGAQFTRVFIVATPVTYGGTWLLGGDRPKNGNGSAWQPRRWVQKGISGHAMAGAIPFLVMAGMTSNPYGQAALYVCSGLTAWSRVDSQSHYPSQVFLGWWLAYLGVRAVRAGKNDPTRAGLPGGWSPAGSAAKGNDATR